MKKLILSVMAMASLALAANAVTYMRVETTDGQIVKYDVETVVKVDYEEDLSVEQGIDVSGRMGKYTYVDLGLSVKWATYNVGATKPTEYGDYFAWGETTMKDNYDWSTYKLCTVDGSSIKLSKYNTESVKGTVDNKKVLESADDAVTANWGAAWRMPTTAEQNELLSGCTWEWVDDFNGSGVAGRLGTSKANGNKIFLPAAGYHSDADIIGDGLRGYYWSSSLYLDNLEYAYYLYFASDNIQLYSSAYRYTGRSVRGVCE